MKTVFSDVSTIAHLWANQLQSEAKNSGRNFFFNGRTIYSYGSHFPIAKHIENQAGERGVLFTERTYSNTTAKHIGVVSRAVNHKNVIYCYSPNASHEQNFNFWAGECESIASNLQRAKKPEIYLNQISRVANKVKAYADFFSLTIPETLQQLLAIEDKGQFAAYKENKAALIAIEEKRKAAAEKKEHAKRLKKWLNGETYSLYGRDGRDYLRMGERDGRQVVETSQAVVIELPEAKRLFDAIKARSLKVGDKVNHQYEVAKINGVLQVGCHTFPTKYLIEFGAKHLKN